VCSAKGCRARATRAVVWNNPKVHAPDREKVWHACDEHVEHLSGYVGVRGFLLRTELLPAEPMFRERELLPEAAEEAPEDPALPG
jgi:hypothetical protein